MDNGALAESEQPTVLTQDQIKEVIRGDKYDDLRIKALHSSNYQSQRETALKEVEAHIKTLKERDAYSIPVTTMRPLEDRVLIAPDKPVTMTESGLYIPETAHKELPETGVVVAVGPGRYINGILSPVGVKPGDRVFYGKYAGTPIQDRRNKETFLCMRYGDVFCVDE